MKISSKIKAFIEQASKSDSYWVEKAKLAFAVALDERRKRAGLSYKDLAQKLETSPAYMTKVFRGDANLTIESMVKLARAAGGQLNLEIEDRTAVARPAWTGHPNLRKIDRHRVVSGIGGTVTQVDFAAANHNFHAIDNRLAA